MLTTAGTLCLEYEKAEPESHNVVSNITGT